MPPKKYRWPIICSWLVHSRNLYLPIEHCPFFPCLWAPCSGTKWIPATLSEKVWIMLGIFSVVSMCLFWGACVIQQVPVASLSDQMSSDTILCVQYQIACEYTKLLRKSSVSELPCQAIHRHSGRLGTQTSTGQSVVWQHHPNKGWCKGQLLAWRYVGGDLGWSDTITTSVSLRVLLVRWWQCSVSYRVTA